MQFTFSPAELRELLEQALSNYRACDSVYDFSADALINTVEQALIDLTVAQADMDKRLENSLPLIDDIPFDGIVPSYETADNISPEAIGLESPF